MATPTVHSSGKAQLLATLIVFLALGGAHRARADGLVAPAQMQTGALLLKTTEAGQYLEAPRLRTDVSVTVTGTIARTRVTQRFENPSPEWVEGTYVFPLPSGAGVDTLRMQVGDRFIAGEVKERQTARRLYERAAAEGRKAALVEQERPNLFTNRVANIDPHGTVVVQIEYQEVVRLSGDRLSLRVPLVVGPRYGGSAPDAERVAAPVLHPSAGVINPVTLRVALDAGVPLAAIASPFHSVRIDRPDARSASVTLAGAVPADRDFVLDWTLAANALPQATLFRETLGDESYYFAMVVPPLGRAAPARQPREAIFVIDNSGSMAGESMEQAKAALQLGLRQLAPNDHFNVIRFDDTFDVLFPKPVPADRSHLARAEQFVAALQASGGTEIHPALRAALVDPTPDDLSRLRQVIFVTDGCVANEDKVLAEIGSSLGRSRLFTVGIGSAPNSYLMEHVARLGRGTFTHIGSETEVVARMGELLAKLEQPVLTDLVASGGSEVETWPVPLPDLYGGEPVVLTARSKSRRGRLSIVGRIGARPWSATLDLGAAAAGTGLEKLWARAKIGALEDLRFRGAAQSEVDAEVLRVALAHHLVSRLTSLVAIDVTPSRPVDAALHTAALPTNLPHGWDFASVFGGDAPDPALRVAAADPAAFAQLARASAPGTTASAPGVSLPQTDAGSTAQMVLGAAFLALGALLLAARWRPSPRPC